MEMTGPESYIPCILLISLLKLEWSSPKEDDMVEHKQTSIPPSVLGLT